MTVSGERGMRRRIDFTAVGALPIGLGLVLAGQALEGGRAQTLLQLTAALIVFGGTCGAVMLSFSTADVVHAVRRLPAVFVDTLEPAGDAIARLVTYAQKARRFGVLSIEADLDEEPDPFLRRALGMAVDGTSQTQIRHAMEVEMDSLAERDEGPSRVFDAAGGYAPTIGILGAVMGLIQVMEHLADPSKLGAGIAVAFVATLYGVGSANLILLPIATKLRLRAVTAARRREMLLHAVLAIQEGVNPRLIEQRLTAFVPDAARPHPTGAVPRSLSVGAQRS